VDLVCGYDARRNSVRVQAQRLLCIARLSSESVRQWHAAGSRFVSRHSISCGRRKNCCAPQHLMPGNQKDNWDDVKQAGCSAVMEAHSIGPAVCHPFSSVSVYAKCTAASFHA
jgi:hypothetical protein